MLFFLPVVGRNRDVDCVGVEEVDSLQTELETLLAAAAKRMCLLQSEIELLDDWINKGGSGGSGVASGSLGNKDKSLSLSSPSVSWQTICEQ